MRTRFAGSIVIWSIALACLVPTVLVWQRLVDDAERIEGARLAQRVDAAENVFTEQLVRFVDLLRAVDGHVSASIFVEQDEYEVFIDRLRLDDSYPGAESTVVFERIDGGLTIRYAAPANEVAERVGTRVDQRHALAPLAEAIGVAVDSNEAVATAILMPNDGSGDLEFYIVRAIPGTDLVAGVRVAAQQFLDELSTQLPEVDIRITDITQVGSRHSLSTRDGGDIDGARCASIDIAQLGRQWRLQVTPLHDALTPSERRQPWVALLAGLAASAAIIGFAVHQGRARRTALRLADRASRSESVHRRLLEAAPLAIVELGPDGSVHTWNSAAAELFGISADEMLGTRFLWPERDRPTPLDSAAAIDALGGRRTTIDTAAGERHVTAFTTAAEASDRRLVIVVDETDQQRLEAQLIQAQKLEVFGRLAGGIAHDFNNFLTAVTGYIDIVLMRDRIEASDRSALLESRRAAERAAAVVAQLLTISRRQVTIPEVVDVAALLHDLSDLLHTVAGDRAQLRLHVGTTDRTPTVRIDRTHLEQIVLNLVVNAGEAMIAAGHIDVWLEQRDGEVVLRVVDDGPGLEPAVAAHVFEPFFTTKAGHGGTGLGLSTVFSIVTSADGTIELTSEPGRGASFEIRFPRAGPEPAVPDAPPVAPAIDPTDETILLVEDDPAVRRLTTAVLQQHGYRVISAGDAEEATSLFLEHRADIGLLLSDVMLPGRSGPQLAAELVRHRPGLPVLFLSGYAEGPLSEGGRLPAGTRFLGKPFRSEDLLREVHEAVTDTR